MRQVTSRILPAFASNIFCLYILICFLRFAYFPANAVVSALLLLAGLILIIIQLNNLKKSFLPLYYAIFFSLISYLISTLFVSNFYRVFHGLVFILIGSGVALTLLSTERSSRFVGLVFYFFTFYFGVNIILGVSSTDLWSHTSYNSISMLMIVICITYYICRHLDGKTITAWPAALTFGICIWAIGRGGILTSALLLLGILLTSVGVLRTFAIICLPITIVVLLPAQIQGGLLELFNNLDAISTASNRIEFGGREPRLIMWENYFNNLNLSKFIFGANIYTDPWADGQKMGFNYHNSFIHLHSRTGLFGFALIAITPFVLMFFYRFNKLYLILFLALILRMSTDSGLFFESLDFLYFYFIFYYLACIGKNNRANYLRNLNSHSQELACIIGSKS